MILSRTFARWGSPAAGGAGWLRQKASLGLAKRMLRRKLVSGTIKALVAQTLLVGVSAVSAIVLARGLGPDGRAAFEAINFLPRLLTPIVQLGLSEANTYFVSRDASRVGHLLANTSIVAFGIGVPAAALCLPLLPAWLHYYDSTVLALAAIFLFTIPLGILNAGLHGLILGQQRYTAYNVVRVIAPVVETALLSALFAAGQLTLKSVAVVHLLAAGLLMLVTQAMVLGGPTVFASFFRRPHLPTLQCALKYGVLCQTATVAETANSSADRALLVALLPPAEFGHFVVATRVASHLLHLPSAVGTVLMPESARSSGQEALRLTLRALVLNAAVACGAAVILFVATPVLLPVLFGEAFRPAVLPAQVLLIGIGAYGLAGIVDSGLKGIGRPVYATVANVVGAAVTVGAMVWLVPVAGTVGAAAGSTAGYLAGLAVLLLFFRRVRWQLARKSVAAQAGTLGPLVQPSEGAGL